MSDDLAKAKKAADALRRIADESAANIGVRQPDMDALADLADCVVALLNKEPS